MTTSSIFDADPGAPEVSKELPSDFFVPTLKTGTIDDDDDPAGERAFENEASVRELPKSFNTTTKDRDDATP